MGEFDDFFRTQAPPVWNYLRRLTGDPERSADLFQRVFLKAWTHFERRSPGSERAWIFTIAVNEARDEMRRRKTFGAWRGRTARWRPRIGNSCGK